MPDYSLYEGDTGDENERDRLFRQFIGEQAARPYNDEAAAPPTTQVEETGRALQQQGGGDDDALKQALRDRAMRDMARDEAAPTSRQAAGPDWTAAIGSVAGLGLDAALNRGRGAGAIVATTAQNMDADRRAEQQRLDHMTEIEARRRDKDPLVAYLGLGNLEQRKFENENIKAGNLAQRTRQVNANVAPDSEEAAGKTKLTELNSEARTEGGINARHNANDIIATDRANITDATTEARNNANNRNAPQKAENDAIHDYVKLRMNGDVLAENAGKRAGAEAPYKKDLQNNADTLRAGDEQRKRDELQRQADQLAGTGRAATPQQVIGGKKTDTANARAYTKDVKDELPVADAGNQLMKIFEAHKDDPNGIPGIGALDSYATKVPFGTAVQDAVEGDEAKVVREHMAMLRARYQHGLTGAASNVPEEKRIEFIAGLQPGATAAQSTNSVRMLKEASDKYLQDFAVGKEDQARTILKNHGLDSLIPSNAPKSGALDTLPVTGKGRAAAGPLVSDAISGGKGPGLDDNGLSTTDAPTKKHHFRSRKTGQLVEVSATDAEKAARPGLDWVD